MVSGFISHFISIYINIMNLLYYLTLNPSVFILGLMKSGSWGMDKTKGMS